MKGKHAANVEETPDLSIGVSSWCHGPVGGSMRYGMAERAETNAGAFGVPHPVVAS